MGQSGTGSCGTGCMELVTSRMKANEEQVDGDILGFTITSSFPLGL